MRSAGSALKGTFESLPFQMSWVYEGAAMVVPPRATSRLPCVLRFAGRAKWRCIRRAYHFE